MRRRPVSILFDFFFDASTIRRKSEEGRACLGYRMLIVSFSFPCSFFMFGVLPLVLERV